MSKIWFTSDTHYNHKNICRGTSTWDLSEEIHQKTRDFDTIEEMNDYIVKGINDNVKENDILYHLGDWSFGGIDSIWEFRRRIKCKNIHLVLGNHDHHIENNRMIYIPLPDLSIYKELVSDLTFHTYIHEVNMECNDEGYIIGYQIPIKTLFTSVKQMLIKEIGGQKMTLCHYAMRTWDKGHHGSWMLFGHNHGTLPEYRDKDLNLYKTMDVGIDSVFKHIGQYKPISLEEIKTLFKDRSNLTIDHHNKNTN